MYKLEKTREFWDANPCGVHENYKATKNHRLKADPWVVEIIDKVNSYTGKILEVGCGQGVDSTLITLEYTGIDYSPESVATASRNGVALGLGHKYSVGNAEELEFSARSFDVYYSCGVLHHTNDEFKAIAEAHRVLKPSGTAFIALYNKASPKVFIALWLRKAQAALDALLETDRCIYKIIRKFGSYLGPFGTMFHECFGVPYLRGYSKKELENMFSAFSSVEIKSYGFMGYIWQIIAKK